jgi:hypothetical protein
MNLTTNAPHGPAAVREYLEARDAGALAMPPNVSAQADDIDFVAELAQTDPRMFWRLQAAQGRRQSTGPHYQVGICDRCANPILDAPFIARA